MCMPASSFALELLDAESGHVLHKWDLEGSDTFQLGRSPDSDVTFASPFVSRTHACLRQVDGGWELSALSRSGVFVDGRRVEHLLLSEGDVFRLAQGGPLLRFRSSPSGGSVIGNETVCFDATRTPLLVLDEQVRDREVHQITEGAYFQDLQRKLAQLRSRPSAGAATSSRTPSGELQWPGS